jgi:hypothetical protein
MVPLPLAHPVVVAGSLEDTTCPPWPIRAQNTTDPAIERLLSLAAVIAPFASFFWVTAALCSWRVPMLPAGMLMAA